MFFRIKRTTQKTTAIVIYVLAFYILIDMILVHVFQTIKPVKVGLDKDLLASLDVIPPIIHQYSSHPKHISQNLKKLSQTWSYYHPQWNYTLWTEKQISNLIAKFVPWFSHTFSEYKDAILKQHAAKYVILFAYGGFIADLDVECLRPYQQLQNKGGLVLAQLGEESDVYSLPIATMGAVRGHPFFLYLLKKLNQTASHISPHADPEIVSGSIFFYYSLKEFLHAHQESLENKYAVTILKSDTFYPYNWNVPSDHARICSAASKMFNPIRCKRNHVVTGESFAFAFKSNRWDTRSEFEKMYRL